MVYCEFTEKPLIPEMIVFVVVAVIQWITFLSHYGKDAIN